VFVVSVALFIGSSLALLLGLLCLQYQQDDDQQGQWELSLASLRLVSQSRIRTGA